jgi:hypothetical protein
LLDEPIRDDWDIIHSVESGNLVYMEFSPVKYPAQGDIAYTLECRQCKTAKMLKGQLFRLELEIPKIRKKSK